MSKEITYNYNKDSVWCGYKLDIIEKEVLLNLTFEEFSKSPKTRVPAFKLVEKAKLLAKAIRIKRGKKHGKNKIN
jgi:hypothetical protein